MKRTMYICDLDVALRKRSDRIVIEKKGEEIAEVRCDELDSVILLGPVEFSTQVVFKLSQHDIELAICTQDGRLIAQLTPPCPANIFRQLKQYDLFRDPSWALSSAKNVVAAKVAGCIDLLEDVSRNIRSKELRHAIHALENRRAGIESADDPKVLLGIEGAAGELWFSLFGVMLKGREFAGRSRRPPRDPVNSLLSLGYRLTVSELNGLIDAVALNPVLGFYHKPKYGRPSLALDLLEEFRAPLVDRFVIRVFNLKQFSDEDFEEGESGTFLKRDSLKRFLQAWEEYQMREFSLPWGVKTWNSAFRAAVDRLRISVDSGEPYMPLPIG